MNPARKTFIIISAVAALAVPAFAHGDKDKEEKVEWNDVPAAVQSTITSNSAGGQVVSVEKEIRRKGNIYEAKVKGTDGKMSEIIVGEAGNLVRVQACDEHEHGDKEHHHDGDKEDKH